MKICFVGKYPPIEGGEAAKLYWLARGLGRRGHNVYIVTNSWEVEDPYREQLTGDDIDFYQPPNVRVFNTSPFDNPWYIPYSKPYTEKLANKTIEVVIKHDPDLLHSWYVLPFAISAFISKIITGKPQVMQHAGSDMSRILDSQNLHTLLINIFRNVDAVLTYPSMERIFASYGVLSERMHFLTKVSVDTEVFNPSCEGFDFSQYGIETNGRPVITYIGKIHVTKGIFDLLAACSMLKDEFMLLMVTTTDGMEHVKDAVKRHDLEEKVSYINFLPPWKMPQLMRASTCIVHPERDFPVRGHNPILPREAMACGTCTVISRELYQKRHHRELQDGQHVVVVDPKEHGEFKGKLEQLIKFPEMAQHIGSEARNISEKCEDFEGYLDDVEKIYNEVLRHKNDSESQLATLADGNET